MLKYNFKQGDFVKQKQGYFHKFNGLVGVINHVNVEFGDEDNCAVTYDFGYKHITHMIPKEDLEYA